MKIENLNVPPVAKPASRGVSFSGLEPSSASAAGKVHNGGSRIAGVERRRSQRVLLRVRAQVHVALDGKTTTFDVQTLNVNPHGALVLMEQNLAPGTRLVLENGTTRERVACKVTRQPRESGEGFQVPLEFDTPAPKFWKITFPPADWHSDD